MASKRRAISSLQGALASLHNGQLRTAGHSTPRLPDLKSDVSAPRPTHGDYTVAWVCALPIELETSRLMLDEEHGRLDAIHGDDNSYVCGRIAANNVVMTVLPGAYGKVNAAVVATNLKRSFPNIQATLMVGVGGGAPAKTDLRLGDVVVGIRVMQYDLGKSLGGGNFRATATPMFPSKMLGAAISNLRSRHESSQRREQWSRRVQELMRTRLAAYPRPDQPDLLFQASYLHLDDADTCDKCSTEYLLPRGTRQHPGETLIHYGGIGSGDKVKRDAFERDKVAGMFDLVCFEMEAAGIIETTRCLPIRGICDYSDTHKNKAWQPHAAAAAAAYARELVETLPPLGSGVPTMTIDLSLTTETQQSGDKGRIVTMRERILQLLSFQEMDDRREAIQPELHKTCRWFLELPKYQQWGNSPDYQASSMGRKSLWSRGRAGSVKLALMKVLPTKAKQQTTGCEFLWIRGKAGTGKSTLMKFLYSEARRRNPADITTAFFFNARSSQNLEKSTQGMYRSLLAQIFKAVPPLQSLLDENQWRLENYRTIHLDLQWLKSLFRTVVENLGTYSLTCFVDALDECDEQEITDMVSSLEDLTERAAEKGTRFRVLLSSRPYPYIKVADQLLVTLEDEVGHMNDLKQYITKRLRVSREIEAELTDTILKQASGIFMWVVLVVGILNNEAKNNGGWALRKRLSELPPTLSQLFKDILTRDTARPEQLRRCILWVLCSQRPLTANEFRFAMWAGALHSGETLDEGLPSLDDDEMNVSLTTSSSKGLVEIISTENNASTAVQFIHESVRDFLVRENGLQEIWPELGLDWEGRAHDILRGACEAYLAHPVIAKSMGSYDTCSKMKQASFRAGLIAQYSPINPDLEIAQTEGYPFLQYATQSILQHANKAQPSVCQQEFISRFFARSHTTLDCTKSGRSQCDSRHMSPCLFMVWEDLHELVRAYLRDHWLVEEGSFPSYEIAAQSDIIFREAKLSRRCASCIGAERVCDGCDIESLAVMISLAMRNRSVEMLAVLLETPAVPLNGRAISMNTDHVMSTTDPHQWAAETDNVILFTLLGMKGIVPSRGLYPPYHSPLTAAAKRGHLGAVKFLVRHGVYLGDDSLYVAAARGHTSVVQLFLDSSFRASSAHNLEAALILASSNGCVETVRLLLTRGVSTATTNYYKAITEALSFGCQRTAVILLKSLACWPSEADDYIVEWLDSATQQAFDDVVALINQHQQA